MTSKTWVPKGYQRTGVSYLLSNPKSGLFLDPGLGKTSISLAAIKILKYAAKTKAVLMVAPLTVCHNTWPDEIAKWSNFNCLTSTVLHGATKASLWGEQKDIYLINPEGLGWLHGELLAGMADGKPCPFNVLWIDESTKFKNHESSRFGLLVDMMPLFKRRHIMTGTPSPKTLMDLWSQIFLLDEGRALGANFYKFRSTYFQANDWNKYDWQLRDFAEEKIQEAIAPCVLDMSAKDYLNMPELVNNFINVALPARAMTQYKTMEKEFFVALDDGEIAAEAAAQAIGKCHQMSNGKVYENIPEGLTEDEERVFRKTRKIIPVHKAKVDAIRALVDELNGKPMLVAYHYKHDLLAIREALGDVPYIGSGVTPEETRRLIKEWNNGNLPILLGHPAAMAHGLNMQDGGNDLCFFSLTWDLELYLQFIARIYRQGVTGMVRVHHLVAKGTIDEAMVSRLGERATQQTSLRVALRKYRKSSVA